MVYGLRGFILGLFGFMFLGIMIEVVGDRGVVLFYVS